jgi:hypothetical protein
MSTNAVRSNDATNGVRAAIRISPELPSPDAVMQDETARCRYPAATAN